MYALHIFTSEKLRHLKYYIIIAPPQRDKLICFLDVDSFQGVRSIFQKTCLISSHLFSIVKILLRAGVYHVFRGCSGCSASTDAELIISCFLDADSFTGFVKGPRRSFSNPTRFVRDMFISAADIRFQNNRAAKTRLTANAHLPNQSLFASTHDPSTHDLF